MRTKEKFEFLDIKELNWLMNNPKLNWLRWVLVIPMALVGLGIVLLIEGIENWFYEPPTWLVNYIQAPLFSFICTLIFVVVGTEMAPDYRRTYWINITLDFNINFRHLNIFSVSG